MDICKRIKELREERHQKQKDIAEKIGITPEAYYYIESGKRNIQLSTLEKIATALDMSLKELLFNETDEHSQSELERLKRENEALKIEKEVIKIQEERDKKIMEYVMLVPEISMVLTTVLKAFWEEAYGKPYKTGDYHPHLKYAVDSNHNDTFGSSLEKLCIALGLPEDSYKMAWLDKENYNRGWHDPESPFPKANLDTTEKAVFMIDMAVEFLDDRLSHRKFRQEFEEMLKSFDEKVKVVVSAGIEPASKV